MKRMRARAGRAVAALTAGALLAGCQFAVVPPKKHAAASSPASRTMRDPYGARLLDAPALLTQCLVSQSGLRPGTGLSWFRDGKVTVSTGNASDFQAWWQAHDKPGPYPQTFRIAGHQTRYLEFGTPWVKRGTLWVPANTGDTNRKALQYSLIAWANWTAANDRLPAGICGSSVTATQVQDQVFGTSTPNPW